ncbi:hypothetical protein H5410_062162 [Solanum commersonii]|uniref:Uncharacterized protein n=1 Tax=Solanum commersonii TaxID=4109 RepID=A0A9J5WAT6_SOLCO|nr:hypothetical protein H5410_062162 [Solanum commersonii]
MDQYLGLKVLASSRLRHDHEPSHKSWSSPLTMKWLVVMCKLWGSLGELLPHHHGWHHDSYLNLKM